MGKKSAKNVIEERAKKSGTMPKLHTSIMIRTSRMNLSKGLSETVM